ncbi:LysE family translocator [Neptuniibacter caesariensis]|uniref:Transporter, LysE family protein n=1 Tax=Neptuniibacter caesariensis TaxID=207954 RepID=A0A7U8C4Y0_NEPCE|nr:LysE family translocator [Neptuniibacter caesariensis]EAR61653.1 Transporter, LysE family protein [Neptuniibacter caesariensis]
MELYIAILVFAFSSTITPGPNNIMIMTSGLNYGIKRSVPHLVGICLGFPLMVAAVGLGFSTIFDKFPILHEIIKVLGVAYLLYLAWLVASAAPSSLESKEQESKPLTFMQAALFQWINPKAWVMATGAVAAFTSQSTEMLIQVMAISLSFFAVSFPCVGSWLLFGSVLKRFLNQPNYQRMFNVSMALLLVVSVLPVLNELRETYLA